MDTPVLQTAGDDLYYFEEYLINPERGSYGRREKIKKDILPREDSCFGTAAPLCVFIKTVSERLYVRRRVRDHYTLKKKFVDTLGWIDEEEMLDLVAIAQSAPGAIAVNGAIVVGYKIAGFRHRLCRFRGDPSSVFIITAVSSAYVFFEKALSSSLF
jgi:hypothetical protein